MRSNSGSPFCRAQLRCLPVLIAPAAIGLVMLLPATAAASVQQVNVTFSETISSSGFDVSFVASGGPFGSGTAGTDVAQVFGRGSLVSQTNPHAPALAFSGTDVYVFPNGTIGDRVDGSCFYDLPVAIGSTFTCHGPLHFTGGTGAYAGADGEGSFQESGTIIDSNFDAVDSGTESWSLHLP
jgi:hypothetical protein